MIFRTLLFFVVMYFLVKIISRFFLQSKQQRGRRGANFFYRVFKQYAQKNQQQNRNRPNNSGKTNNDQSNRFEEIEEAEFEEITDDEETTSKSSE